MIHYMRETFTQAWADEAMPLFELHYAEIARFKDIRLNPDVDRYLKAEAAGMLRVYTARLNDGLDGRLDGRLVGYGVYGVARNGHYKDSLQAVQDILFMHPNHRGTGGRLIAFADKELAREGVDAVYQHVKVYADFGPLLARQGYEHVENIWCKRLTVQA